LEGGLQPGVALQSRRSLFPCRKSRAEALRELKLTLRWGADRRSILTGICDADH
jgi:hypothetical protein